MEGGKGRKGKKRRVENRKKIGKMGKDWKLGGMKLVLESEFGSGGF